MRSRFCGRFNAPFAGMNGRGIANLNANKPNNANKDC